MVVLVWEGGRDVGVVTGVERPEKFPPPLYASAVKMMPPELQRGASTAVKQRKVEINRG